MKVLDKLSIRGTAKKLGFCAKGDFLIGLRSQDVISGLAIDSTPSSTYVWTFLLPAFDDVEFMHMSLGHRAANLTASVYPLETELDNVWKRLSSITHAAQLITHLDTHEITGEYADWTRFLCRIRLSQLDEADQMLAVVNEFRSAAIPRKLKEIHSSLASGGWPAVQRLLIDWSARTDRILVGVPAVTIE